MQIVMLSFTGDAKQDVFLDGRFKARCLAWWAIQSREDKRSGPHGPWGGFMGDSEQGHGVWCAMLNKEEKGGRSHECWFLSIVPFFSLLIASYISWTFFFVEDYLAYFLRKFFDGNFLNFVLQKIVSYNWFYESFPLKSSKRCFAEDWFVKFILCNFFPINFLKAVLRKIVP